MEHKLNQSQYLAQKQILTPQLRQFLRLLELPLLDLEQTIQEELIQNPALEEVPEAPEETNQMEPDSNLTPQNDFSEQDIATIETWLDRLQATKTTSDLSMNNQKDLQRKKDYEESILTSQTTLSEYLQWQLGLLNLGEKEREIALQIIGNINDDGYLKATLDEITQVVGVTLDLVKTVLNQIQSLDPPGVGAQNLNETLCLQLKRKNEDTSLAQKIVLEHLDLLRRKQFDQLAKIYQTQAEKIKNAYNLLIHLEPKPGRIFYRAEHTTIVPDARAYFSEDDPDQLLIELHRERLPSLRINPEYRKLYRQANLDKNAKTFLKNKIQSGLEIIRALAQRGSTLKRITEELVLVQKDFFTKGFSQLKPLRLKDIAEKIGIHESTVSRAIHGKYLDTPQGVIPFKSFFSSKLVSEDGSLESQKSALAMLKNLISQENKKKPLSDSALVQSLEAQGFHIARRTVAKYRDLLNILPAHLRKEF